MDAASLDDVIAAMYRSLCFEEGQRPDWPAFLELFAADARLVRVNDDGVFAFDPRTFRDNLETMIASGTLRSFWEGEVSRETEVFGDIAQVLSFYEARSSRDGALLGPAVKTIQLFQQNGRWWISAMLWRREGRVVKLPTTSSRAAASRPPTSCSDPTPDRTPPRRPRS
jgi:hypothetical protein